MNEADWFGLESPRLEEVRVFGVTLRPGDRVRVWPKQGGDILDMALAGKVAVIEAIELDFEERVHLALVMEDDPGRDMGALRMPGHRFFFAPDEVEPMRLPDNSEAGNQAAGNAEPGEGGLPS